MIDVFNEAGTYHLITDDITHAHHRTFFYIYVLRIDILFNRFYCEVVFTLGSVVAAGFDSGLAGRLFSGFLLIRLRLCCGGLLFRLLGKTSGLESSHLGFGFAETLIALLEKRLKVGYCLLEFRDGRFE